MNKDLAIKCTCVALAAMLLICIIFLIVDGVKDRKVRENNYNITIQLATEHAREVEILEWCARDLDITMPRGASLNKVCDIVCAIGNGAQYTLYIPEYGLFLVGVNYDNDGEIHYVDVEGQIY